jgi:thymidylate synthase
MGFSPDGQVGGQNPRAFQARSPTNELRKHALIHCPSFHASLAAPRAPEAPCPSTPIGERCGRKQQSYGGIRSKVNEEISSGGKSRTDGRRGSPRLGFSEPGRWLRILNELSGSYLITCSLAGASSQADMEGLDRASLVSELHFSAGDVAMNGIPVLHVEGNCIARAWEESLIELNRNGCSIRTQYDKPGDPPSKDATMLITIHHPLEEPMIHKDFPGGPVELQEYVMEVCEGIKDHLVRDQRDPEDTRWEYTYHQRLFNYQVPSLGAFDQMEILARKLAAAPHTRRAQAITWKVWEDNDCYDPACLQSIWCRILEVEEEPVLSMNVRFRSNDAYKAAFMNMFALVQLQRKIAERISELSGRRVQVGRYCHMADSYHIYGSYFREFEGRFLAGLAKRTFEQRTMRYGDVREMMEEARPEILDKAKKMGR